MNLNLVVITPHLCQLMALRGSDCGGDHIGPRPKHLWAKMSAFLKIVVIVLLNLDIGMESISKGSKVL